jgi:hypothetical protein
MSKTIHQLKTQPESFNVTLSGIKPIEYRNNDRKFKVGDLLKLNEYDLERGGLTGRSIIVEVTYILAGVFGLAPNWVILGIRKTEIKF